MQRKNNTYGYFSGNKFSARDNKSTTDEISLNPRHFADRSVEEIFSTLVHEMVHLKQYHSGTQSRGGYHNADWAQSMREVGLIPSSTGRLGGKETGQKVSHFIEEGGRFAVACAELINVRRLTIPYVEIADDDEEDARRRSKVKSKTKYTCVSCGANAWAKPVTKLDCGECHLAMQAWTAGPAVSKEFNSSLFASCIDSAN